MSQWWREQYTDVYFRRGTIEDKYYERRKLRPDQIIAIRYCRGFHRILSIGIGRGYLEHWLWQMGHEVTSVDVEDNRHFLNFRFVRGGMEAIPAEDFDAVVLVESLEHIPEDEFKTAWPGLVSMLRKTRGRFITSNWDHLWPIRVNGMDHLWEINDSVFDWLASFGKTVYRKQSTLVLECE